jgi:hypothetical protein
MLAIAAYDLTARPGYNQRNFPVGAVWTPREEILFNLEALLLQTVGAIDEMSRAPRKTPGDDPQARVFRVPNAPGSTIELRGIPGVTIPPKKPPGDSTKRPPA